MALFESNLLNPFRELCTRVICKVDYMQFSFERLINRLTLKTPACICALCRMQTSFINRSTSDVDEKSAQNARGDFFCTSAHSVATK